MQWLAIYLEYVYIVGVKYKELEMSFVCGPKKSIRSVLVVIRMLQSEGYLKDATLCAGRLIHDNYEYILKQVTSGDLSNLNDIYCLPNSKKERELLFGYINIYFPVRYHLDSIRVSKKALEDIDVDQMKNLLIDFGLYKKLSVAKPDIGKEDIISIVDQVKLISSNWQGYLVEFLKWPSTDAPASLQDLIDVGWIKAGMLAHFGYRVGLEGHTYAQRILTLDKLF